MCPVTLWLTKAPLTRFSASLKANCLADSIPVRSRPWTTMCSSGGQQLGKSHCWPLFTRDVGTPPGKESRFWPRAYSVTFAF